MTLAPSAPVTSSALRDARLDRGLSPADVAAAVGVHPQTVLRWERWERLPGWREVEGLARALAVPREAVLREVDAHRPSPDRSAGYAGPGLRALRRRAGVPVAELARRVGVSPSTVYNWEHGRVRVPPVHVEALAVLLDLPVGDLVRVLRASAGLDVVQRAAPSTVLGRRRVDLRLTVSEVARRTGLARHRLAALEAGAPFGRASEVRALAEVLRCPPGALLRVHPVEDPLLLRPAAWAPGHLPRLVRAHRRWGGDTQAALARALGCSADAVRCWERGSATPAPTRRRALERRWRLPEHALDRAAGAAC